MGSMNSSLSEANQHLSTTIKQNQVGSEAVASGDFADGGSQIALLVVKNAVLPAAPEDADPFEGESPKSGLVMFTRGALLSVVRLGPSAFGDGTVRPIRRRFAGGTWRIPSPVDPELATALLFDGSNSSILLEAAGVGITGAGLCRRRRAVWARLPVLHPADPGRGRPRDGHRRPRRCVPR